MNQARQLIVTLSHNETEGAAARIAGRLVALSPAALGIEDASDRRSFGVLASALEKCRLRLGDIVEAGLAYENHAWRVRELQVLVPCLLLGQDQRAWMQRWFRQGDKLRRHLHLRERLFTCILLP